MLRHISQYDVKCRIQFSLKAIKKNRLIKKTIINNNYVFIYLNDPHEQEATQGQFKQNLTCMNLEISSIQTKEPSRCYHLPTKI